MGKEYKAMIKISGKVQGVGFRYFVYQLAISNRISGWVKNSGAGVTIEAEASKEKLEEFIEKIRNEKPSIAEIKSLNYVVMESCCRYFPEEGEETAFTGFEILPSEN